jgi:hypothetical protein
MVMRNRPPDGCEACHPGSHFYEAIFRCRWADDADSKYRTHQHKSEKRQNATHSHKKADRIRNRWQGAQFRFIFGLRKILNIACCWSS